MNNTDMENLKIWNESRVVPTEAIKPIMAGRLKGKSDINPVWRLKLLTSHFGPCGFGWKYTITRQWLEQGANGEQSAFVNIDLYVKVGETWSDAIPGTGGSSFVANEKSGPYTSDECYKMALTDAFSVACKALGFGADVYWNADNSNREDKADLIGTEQLAAIRDLLRMGKVYNEAAFCSEAKINALEYLPMARYKGAFAYAQGRIAKETQEA